MFNRGLTEPLPTDLLEALHSRARRSRAAVLTATTVAGSGHPGGSFSSMEIYTLLYGTAKLLPSEPRWPDRDRIVISHGHTSPGAYTALACAGFFPIDEVEAHFRQAGSVFEGHVERSVPGIEWSSGNLGQGLSAGVGLALGARLTGASWHTVVAMSDGEQQKGQVGEARRLAVKEGLGNITAIVDWNRAQISGHTHDVMPVPVDADWEADGWRVYRCDGHDMVALHEALAAAVDDGVPSVVLADTVIGKGLSFIEDDPDYHGKALTAEEYGRAVVEIGIEPEALERATQARHGECRVAAVAHETPQVPVRPGTPRTYGPDERTDNRSAWGKALVDLAVENAKTPIAVFDCDLSTSVKTDGFAKQRPSGYVQCGVGEHNAATASGALSTVEGTLSFWSDFGVFGIDEVYNQQRLNDINGAALKLVVTHCGLDVGEDGKTHQCIDYVGAFREQFGWKVIVPADPNQTDRATRAMAGMQGCVAMAMGRSKLPVILSASGEPLFGGSYEFAYGDAVWAREGIGPVVLTMGTVAGVAVAAADELRSAGDDIAVAICASPLSLPDALIDRISSAPLVITAEDHNALTGLGATVAGIIAERGLACRLVRLGVTRYRESGTAADVLARAGLDARGIAASIRQAL